MDGAQWVQRAREKCMALEDGLGWNWSKMGTTPAYFGELPKLVRCSYIESSADFKDSSISSAAMVCIPPYLVMQKTIPILTLSLFQTMTHILNLLTKL